MYKSDSEFNFIKKNWTKIHAKAERSYKAYIRLTLRGKEKLSAEWIWPLMCCMLYRPDIHDLWVSWAWGGLQLSFVQKSIGKEWENIQCTESSLNCITATTVCSQNSKGLARFQKGEDYFLETNCSFTCKKSQLLLFMTILIYPFALCLLPPKYELSKNYCITCLIKGRCAGETESTFKVIPLAHCDQGLLQLQDGVCLSSLRNESIQSSLSSLHIHLCVAITVFLLSAQVLWS